MFMSRTRFLSLLAASMIFAGSASADKEVLVVGEGESDIIVAPLPPQAPAAPGAPAPAIRAFTFNGGGGFLGVVPEDITPDKVQQLGLREEYGAHFTSIVPDSPAAKAGLQADDVVLTWNGTRVESAAQFRRFVQETPQGRTVRLGVFREGSIIEVPVEIATRDAGSAVNRLRVLAPNGAGHSFAFTTPPDAAFFDHQQFTEEMEAMAKRMQEQAIVLQQKGGQFTFDRAQMEELQKHVEEIRQKTADGKTHYFFTTASEGKGRIGLHLQSLTPQLGEFFGASEGKGVLIANVVEGSPAEEAGLRAGDVIVKIIGEPVADPAEAMQFFREFQPGDEFDLTVLRNKRSLDVNLTFPEADAAEKSKSNSENK